MILYCHISMKNRIIYRKSKCSGSWCVEGCGVGWNRGVVKSFVISLTWFCVLLARRARNIFFNFPLSSVFCFCLGGEGLILLLNLLHCPLLKYILFCWEKVKIVILGTYIICENVRRWRVHILNSEWWNFPNFLWGYAVFAQHITGGKLLGTLRVTREYFFFLLT